MYVSELEQRKKQEVSFRLSGSNSADNRSVYQNSFNYEAKTLKCCRKSDFINDYVYKTTRADGDSLSTMKNTNIYKSKKNNCEAERSRGLEVLLTNNE